MTQNPLLQAVCILKPRMMDFKQLKINYDNTY